MSKRKKRRRQRRPEGRAGQPTQAVPAEDVSSNVPVDVTGSSETVLSEGVLSETVLSEGVSSESVLSEDVSSDDLSTAPVRLAGRGDAGPRHDAGPREEPRFRSYFDLLAEKYPDGESAPRVVGGDRRGEGGKSGDGGGTTGVYPRPLLARRMRRERSGRDYRAIVVAVLGLFAVGVVLAVVLTTTPSRRPELPSRPQERRAEDPAAPARSPVASSSPDASPANPSSDRAVPGASTPTARDTTAPADTVRAPAAEPPVEVVVVDSDPTIEEFTARFDELDRSAAGAPGAVGDGAAPGGPARGTAAGGSAADDERVEIAARAESADSLVESDTVPRDRTVIRPRREASAPRGPPQRGAATRRPATRPAETRSSETRSSETSLSDTGLSERQETASAGESPAGELSASEPSAPGSLPDPSPAAERVAVAEGPVARTAPAEATRADDTDLAAIDQVVAVDDAAAMTQARRVFAPQPRYPEAARQNSEQGTVVLVGTVGVNGVVRDARVLRGRSPALDRAALEAFRTWQFEPAQLGGAAIESTYRVGINFRLDPEREQSAAPLPFGGDFVPPVRLSTPQPEYPAAAWAAGVSGLVVLELVVGIDGRVQGVDVLQGLPNGVTEAAVAAVRTWTFRPASRKGLRVAVRHRVTLRFDPP